MREATENPTLMDPLWSIDDLATYLGCGRRYVYRLTAEDRIRYFRIGRELRFHPDDVADYLAREALGHKAAS